MPRIAPNDLNKPALPTQSDESGEAGDPIIFFQRTESGGVGGEKTVMNREGWLTELARKIEEIFSNYSVSPYRVTMGWPSSRGLSPRKRVVGECHSDKTSRGEVHEIFISPVLEKPEEVAGTLAHELAHVVAGIDARHGTRFRKIARSVGLTSGSPTAVMPGEMLAERIRRMMEPIGSYPHQAIVPVAKRVRVAVKMISLSCRQCGIRIRMGAEDLEGAGFPTCGCGGTFRILGERGEGE